MPPNGWINQDLFIKWQQKLFNPSVPPALPVILLIDGHSSHYNCISCWWKDYYCLSPASHYSCSTATDVSFLIYLNNEREGRVLTKFQFYSLGSRQLIQPQLYLGVPFQCYSYQDADNEISSPSSSSGPCHDDNCIPYPGKIQNVEHVQ